MNNFFSFNEDKYRPFITLRNQIDEERNKLVETRIAENPFPSADESQLGAFLEMYEPQVRPVVIPLLRKGYPIDVSSGFDGKYSESQSLHGPFPLEDLVINKLAKIGVKLQKNSRYKSLKFWPVTPDLAQMTAEYTKIMNLLPQCQITTDLIYTERAMQFRVTYIPQDAALQRVRLFEILLYSIVETMAAEIKTRLIQNPQPDDFEINVGVYREMIEPQVRTAVIELNRKGYSTDASGFMSTSDTQTLDGDFMLEESQITKLHSIDVSVITNPSGYTRLTFKPAEADLQLITKKWDYIASLLPDKGTAPKPSMTKKARAFRSTHASRATIS